jgi:hypothetical protein
MIDENINRFCKIVNEVNELNLELETQKNNFYSGGYSFEEVYESEINKLINLQKELKVLMKLINKN